MTTQTPLARRWARLLAVTTAANYVAVLVLSFVWPSAVLPLIIGMALAWLTAVAWVGFTEARRTGVR